MGEPEKKDSETKHMPHQCSIYDGDIQLCCYGNHPLTLDMTDD